MTKTPEVLSYDEREDMLDRIERQAEYRAERAERYPDDKRNGKAVEGLRILRQWFKQQSNDSPLMVRLSRALAALDPERLADSDCLSSIDERLARFNFHNFTENDDPAEFFASLVQGIEEHAVRTVTVRRAPAKPVTPVTVKMVKPLPRRGAPDPA